MLAASITCAIAESEPTNRFLARSPCGCPPSNPNLKPKICATSSISLQCENFSIAQRLQCLDELLLATAPICWRDKLKSEA